MSRTRIKICGNTNPADLAHAIACGADAVGFITDVPVRSPRKIDTETAKELIKQVPVFVESVLVIMHPTCVQIHSDLPVSELAEISKTVKLIKTIAVPKDAPSGIADHIISRIDALTGIADAILLDTSIGSRTSTGARSGGEGGGGGTGKVHDWGISAEVVKRSRLPIILAGGLTPDNASDAIRKVHPYAVDTASGVETDGKRNPDKVRRFIGECMMADGVADDD